LIGTIAGDSIHAIGDRWPDTLATHERLIEGRANHGEEGTATLDAARRSKPPRNHNATANRRGNPWRFLPYTQFILLKINLLLDPTI
jgi:hypothetical protein